MGGFGAGGGEAASVERTQPMERESLNIATRGEAESNPFLAPPPGVDLTGAGFGTGGQPGDDQALRNQIFEAIAPVLGELATEIRRSLDYYRSRAQGRSVDRVMLSGGGALLGNLTQFLQNELQVPVYVADPFMNLQMASRRYDPAFLQSVAPTFAIAVGLAVRDSVFKANPAPKKPKQKKVKQAASAPPPDPATVQAV
jgi:type IV pilus assembly protein PilM